MEKLPTVDITGPHQTRPERWLPEWTAFGDHLEAVMAAGVHDLEAIAVGLNERRAPSPDGAPWTTASLAARLAELAR
jgi:hypothetical protein